MIEILEQAIELYEKDRKEKKKSKENIFPQTPQKKVDKQPLPNETTANT